MYVWLLKCLKDLKRKYHEKEDRYKSLASLDEMHTKLEELQKQMAWALVRSFFIIFVSVSLDECIDYLKGD